MAIFMTVFIRLVNPQNQPLIRLLFKPNLGYQSNNKILLEKKY